MKKRYILMAVTAALVFAVAAGGTMAANRVETDEISDIATPLASQTLEIGLSEGTKSNLVCLPGDELVATTDEKVGDFEEFKVTNSKEISAYVRVTIQKYWVDSKGDRLAADNVTWDIGADENWIKQEDPFDPKGETNSDTVVFYYKTPLATGNMTSGLLDKIQITAETTGNAYSGATLYVKAVADGVQFADGYNDVNRNGIKAAWGVNVELDADGNITSKTVTIGS